MRPEGSASAPPRDRSLGTVTLDQHQTIPPIGGAYAVVLNTAGPLRHDTLRELPQSVAHIRAGGLYRARTVNPWLLPCRERAAPALACRSLSSLCGVSLGGVIQPVIASTSASRPRRARARVCSGPPAVPNASSRVPQRRYPHESTRRAPAAAGRSRSGTPLESRAAQACGRHITLSHS